MKKYLGLIILPIFLLAGCSMSNSPTSQVEALFTKYQTNDSDISNNIDEVLAEQNLTDTQTERYRKLLEKQYKNLSYEIKDEVIDGDNATITVEIEVADYKKAINNLTFDSSIYSKETYDDEKLTRLEGAKDKVMYTLNLTATKDKNGKWKLNALTNDEIKKIQGMY